jgi:hypothetical protein
MKVLGVEEDAVMAGKKGHGQDSRSENEFVAPLTA